jgi:type IV pilus assembly protein PilB
MARSRLGELLCERKCITADELELALQEQGSPAVLLGELLLQRGTVGREDLAPALEQVLRVAYLDAALVTPTPGILKRVPRSLAQRYCVLPVSNEHRKLVTIMAEPQNLAALDELRFVTGMNISPRLGFRAEIQEAIEKHYRAELLPAAISAETASEDGGLIEFVSSSSTERNQAAMREFQAEMQGARTPATRLVSSFVYTAAAKKASDIHVEPRAHDAVVRIRIDGILQELATVAEEIRNQLVSRIKILADMDIAERRVPQDGRFLARVNSRQLDLRVSTLPTQYGEKVVMRILDPTAAGIPFEGLGFSPESSAALAEVLAAPQGMVLVTGPTGSGKSTTLYSALNVLRSPRVNIITIEDPVEYVVEGVNQVQVHAKAGRTFASCLRSMLRQDPNIIMVGEIRDGETAEIALTAAQTGHLVLSTLHTNDSIAAITRLLDLNVPAFLVASSVTAIIAQRLVRKLCACRDQVAVTAQHRSALASLGLAAPGEIMYLPAGCAECENSGYKGRTGIYEVLVMNEQLRAALRAGARDDELRDIARAAGLTLMQEDALSKVHRGITTLQEVLRVVPFEDAGVAVCRNCSASLAPKFLYCPFCGTAQRQEPQRGPQRPRKGAAVA